MLVVLVLGAYRLTRLLGWDDFPPVHRARGWVIGEHKVTVGSHGARNGLTGEELQIETDYTRPTLAHFVHCPFCLGFWVSVCTYAVWCAAGAPGHWGHSSWLMYAVVPFALSGAVGLISKNLDP